MITIQAYRCAIGTFNLMICKVKFKIHKSKTNNNKVSFFFIFLLLLMINTSSSYEGFYQRNNSRMMKSINGNISNKGSYYFISWNKGNSKFTSKRDDISITLDRLSPDFFAIHEANFDNINDKGFQNYNLEYKKVGNDKKQTHGQFFF